MLINGQDFSQASLDILHKNGLESDEISRFSTILEQAKKQIQQQGQSAKSVLLGLSEGDKELVGRANGLQLDKAPQLFTEESALNFFSQPDRTDLVDLDGNGAFEVYGEAELVRFPPLGAPDFVKEAWESVSSSLTKEEAFKLKLDLLLAMHSVQPETPIAGDAFSWDRATIDKMFMALENSLNTQKQQFGASEWINKAQDFYARFKESLLSGLDNEHQHHAKK